MSEIIWYLQTTFDRKVAFPGEGLFASATLRNPNHFPIFIGECYWHFSCYPDHAPGRKELKKIVPPEGLISVPPWQLPIPNIPAGQYEAEVSFDTWVWNAEQDDWQFVGRIFPDRNETFFIIHEPRFRAFISRSNHDHDRPIVEPIIATIQQWGFNTHTVGINEIEEDGKVPPRIIEEILKSDCVFAIATPRDFIPAQSLFRTLTWLHNEVSFSYMADKTTLLIAEENVLLDGLIGTQQVPRIKYSSQDLHTFLLRLNDLMPVIREVLLEKSYRKWQQREIDRIERIRYESFMAGMAVQKSLLLDLV